MAGITGTTKWNYDVSFFLFILYITSFPHVSLSLLALTALMQIFGPTVIEAFMMEASGLPGSITISPAVNVAISVVSRLQRLHHSPSYFAFRRLLAFLTIRF